MMGKIYEIEVSTVEKTLYTVEKALYDLSKRMSFEQDGINYVNVVYTIQATRFSLNTEDTGPSNEPDQWRGLLSG